MLKLSKPRKPSKNDPSKWHTKRSDLERVIEYCKKDILAEVDLLLSIPFLTPKEREIWCLDQRINQRGFMVDRVLVFAAQKVRNEELARMTGELSKLTGGLSPNQNAKLIQWFSNLGVSLPNMQAGTISALLELPIHNQFAKEALEILKWAKKTSTKKYDAFEMRSRSDGRLRDILMYWAASTGRWGGTGVQPQNFPRGSLKDSHTAADILKTGDLELVRLCYGEPMEVLVSCLRACIVAEPGTELFVADYNAIEARMLFWLSCHTAGVEAFTSGRDLYREMAMVIYGKKQVNEITEGERFVGKQAILGCGYGMGWKKFIGQCANYKVEISEDVAKKAIKAYRETHDPVPTLWRDVEYAATMAVKNKGTTYLAGRCKWRVEGRYLYAGLPSGRRLAFFDPSVKYEPTPWGEKKAVLYHFGVDSMTKKWRAQKTWGGTLVENICQAVSRDIMAEAMVRVEKEGYINRLTVHDEALATRAKGKGSLADFIHLLEVVPDWAKGAPIKAAGWVGERYKK